MTGHRREAWLRGFYGFQGLLFLTAAGFGVAITGGHEWTGWILVAGLTYLGAIQLWRAVVGWKRAEDVPKGFLASLPRPDDPNNRSHVNR